MNTFEKLPSESMDEYTMRIGNACHAGEMTWVTAASYLNKAAGTDYGESKFRKYFKAQKAGYDYAAEHCGDESVSDELKRLKIEQVKMRDERAAMNRMYRATARSESIKEIIKSAVQPYEKYDFNIQRNLGSEDSDIIVCLSDLHTGNGANNAWNVFNKDVLHQRLESYLYQLAGIVTRHKTRKAHVLLLGDLINGHIHINSRIENNEDSIQQVMTAAELISSFIMELNSICPEIDVYSVSGNHSRVFPNKEESTSGEQLEELIPFYLKARLQNFDGVDIITDKTDPSFGGLKAHGKLIMYAHGDKDTPSNVADHLTTMIKQPIDMIFLGHRHTNGLTTVHGTKVIESGCVCGVDSYAVGLRLNDVPQQMVAIIDDNGLQCLYDVKLAQPAQIKI